MKSYILTAALLGSAITFGLAPALAFNIENDDAMCPIEAIGEEELDSWASSLADGKGQMTDAQTDIFGAAVKSCAEKLSWSENDTVSALEFNLSIIAGTAIGDWLTSEGIDAVSYEVVLENRSAEDLRQVLNDPDNSPALKDLVDKLIADFGDDLTDETTADIATYIAFMAQSQLSAMKMMGLAE